MLKIPDLNTNHRLRAFVSSFEILLDRSTTEAEILEQGGVLLADLVREDDWLPEEFAEPNPGHYQQFLLYLDPQERFSILSFVWGPGQRTPIHNHTVWGLVGVLRGCEHAQAYKNRDGLWVPDGTAQVMMTGQVEAVSPILGDVHQVANGLKDQASISIHVYGADIGKVRRSLFRENGDVKEFVSGYSNQNLS